MSYTDKSGKIITEVYGPFKVYAYEAVKDGDLVYFDTTNEGVIPADQSDNEAAHAVCVNGGAAGDTVTCAMGVVFRSPATCTSGVWSDNALAAAGDVGSPLYLGESGAASTSQGATNGQQVGRILDIYTARLVPGEFLTDTNVSLSGTLTVAGVTSLNSVNGQGASFTNGSYTGALSVIGALTGTTASFTNGSYTGALDVHGALTGMTSSLTSGSFTGDLDVHGALTGMSASFTNGSFTGTMAITGATTATGAITANGGVAYAASKGPTYGVTTLTGTTGALQPGMNIINCASAGSYTLGSQAAGVWVGVAASQALGAITLSLTQGSALFDTGSSTYVSGAKSDDGIQLVSAGALRFVCIGKSGTWTPT